MMSLPAPMTPRRGSVDLGHLHTPHRYPHSPSGGVSACADSFESDCSLEWARSWRPRQNCPNLLDAVGNRCREQRWTTETTRGMRRDCQYSRLLTSLEPAPTYLDLARSLEARLVALSRHSGGRRGNGDALGSDDEVSGGGRLVCRVKVKPGRKEKEI
jgi:hypothetical protein